jgi:hypothetical protein
LELAVRFLNCQVINLFGSGLSGLGIIETITDNHIFQSRLLMNSDIIRYGFTRSSVTFGHPINFGMYQSIMAALAFYRITNTDITRKKRNFFFIMYAIISVSVVVSVSRLAICLLLFSQFLALRKLELGKKKNLFISAIIAIVLSVFLTDILGFEFLNELISDFWKMICEVLGINLNSKAEISYGNRFDLYNWVIDDVKGHEWFGLGVGAKFSYKMHEWFTKTSIEVHYLYVYYQQGLFGLFALILSYVGSLYFIQNKKEKKLGFEGILNFNTICFFLLIGYFVCLFGVQETDLKRIYNVLLTLNICYNRICHQSLASAEYLGNNSS